MKPKETSPLPTLVALREKIKKNLNSSDKFPLYKFMCVLYATNVATANADRKTLIF